MFNQYIQACSDHDACAVIRCTTDSDVVHPDWGTVIHAAGTDVWSSHLDAAIHVEHRINPDVRAVDLTNGGQVVTHQPVCSTCASHPSWPT